MLIRTMWTCLALVLLSGRIALSEPRKLPAPPKPIAERSFVIPPWPRNSATAPWGLTSRGGGPDIRVFRFSPDGHFLVGMTNGAWELEVRQVPGGASMGTFAALQHHGGALCLSPNGTRAVIAQSPYSHIDLWDWKRRKLIRNLDEGVITESISQAVFLDERRCVFADLKGGLWLWDVETGDELDRWRPRDPFDAKSTRYVRAMAASPDSATLAVVENKLLYLVDAATGKLRTYLASLPQRLAIGQPGYFQAIRCMEFSRDGRILAVGCENCVRLYDVTGGEELPPLTEHSGGIRALHFAPDGRSLLSLGRDNRLLTWKLADIDHVWTYPGKPSPEDVRQSCDQLDPDDAWQSYITKQLLRSAPESAVAELSKRLRPATALTPADMERLADRLESGDPNERKAAMQDAQGAIKQAFELLRRRSLERGRAGDGVRPEADELFRWTRALHRKPADVQRLDAELIRVLPLIGTAEAKTLAEELAAGASDSYRTTMAREALELWPSP